MEASGCRIASIPSCQALPHASLPIRHHRGSSRMVRMDRSFGGFVFIGQMAWLGAVCFCWSRADVVGHLIEEVCIMLEVGCLFEALRKALGALVEQKLSDVVTL